MNGMNGWLAQTYGTAGAVSAEDLEKQAQAELLSQLAGNPGGFDLNSLSAQELQQLSALLAEQQMGGQAAPQQPAAAPAPAAVQPGQGGLDAQNLLQQLLQLQQQGGQAGQGQPAPQGGTPGAGQPAPGSAEGAEAALMKEAAEKFQEADFLGRVMAHAYCNELQKIAAAQQAAGEEQEKAAAMEHLKGMLAKHKEKSEKSGPTSHSDKSMTTGHSDMSGKTEKTAAEQYQQAVASEAEKLAANWLVQNGFAVNK